MAVVMRILLVAALVSMSAISGEAPKRDEPNRGGTMDLASQDPKVALERFKVPAGYKIELFASEKEFPELADPLAMTFDSRGRLWVTTMPSYPQYLPPHKPNDKILILEDTNADGKADTCKVFADGLYLPTGIELGMGGVFSGSQPNLLFLKDTDGDDKADYREIYIHGLGTEDSHHAVHAFYWTPDGALLFHEGIFHNTQAESPHGVMRLKDSGSMRFEPRTHKLDVFITYNFANPWGHVFDRWGQNFLADASGGSNYFASAISGYMEHPEKHSNMKVFTTVVRPTCGCVLVSSRHFPDEAQGNFLVNNNIGFQGTKQHQVYEEGSGFHSNELEPILQSSDPNFRPVAIRFAPDGSLYIVDWFNPLIGHMQYSLRDERRDHTHGRIWRITYPGRPLVKAPKIAGASTLDVLNSLKEYEDDTRYRARRELNARNRDEVLPVLKKWLAELDTNDKDYEHHLLEGLWVYQTLNTVEPELLNKLLNAKEPRARAAATRALRYWLTRIPEPLTILRKQLQDEFPRVRLEALLTLSFFKGDEGVAAAELALQALNKPTDYYLDYVLNETMRALSKYWKPIIASGKPFAADNAKGLEWVLNNISVAELAGAVRSKPVYQALLSRENVAVKERREALTGLAKLNNRSELDELAAAIRAAKGETITDLANILADWDAAALAGVRDFLVELASKQPESSVRRGAYVALMRADNSVERTWTLASASIRTLTDFLDGIELLKDQKLLGEIYPKVLPLLAELPANLQAQRGNGLWTRYVRIELPGPRRILALAEVEVFSGGTNVALKGRARQASTAFGGVADRAIDGRTDGKYVAGTTAHSEEGMTNPWWEVDLGTEQLVDKIVVWNRTDPTLGERLDKFIVAALDARRAVVFRKADNPAPAENAAFEINGDSLTPLRRAAINALGYIPGKDAESFGALSTLLQKNVELDVVLLTLKRLKREAWPKDKFPEMAQNIGAYVVKVPLARRDTAEFAAALDIGRFMAAAMPADAAKPLLAAMRSVELQFVTVKTVEEQMKYDVSQFFVEAGRPVEITFENPDVMQHNLLVVEPGAMAEVGQLAEALGASGFGRNFIPDSPKILFKSKLINPKTTEKMRFIAPTKTGDYPYLCTFPGHWIIMNGLMTVVAPGDPNAGKIIHGRQQAEPLPPVAELVKLSGNADAGKAVFQKTCVVCHKVGDVGVDFGPNLSQVATRLKKDKLFESVLEPDATIDPKFQAVNLKLMNGEIVTGLVREENQDTLTLKVGGENIRAVPKAQISKRNLQKTSVMPQGLTETMNKQQLVDLVEYLSTLK